MKKLFLIIFSIFNAHAMESEVAPYLFKNMPEDIQDLIASFLTFDDIESEEEFVQREKSISDYPSTKVRCNKKREIASSWLIKHQYITDTSLMLLHVYSANNNLCAMTHIDGASQRNMIIVDTRTAQELNNFYLIKKNTKKYIQQLAISSSGNIFAIQYNKWVDEDIGFRNFIKIQNICTQKKEYPTHPVRKIQTIAFNKQGTHLIAHHYSNRHNTNTHTIIPLTTTLDNIHNEPQKKTLKHYFAQKMICKAIQ
jgi:hypothetical protein